MVRNRAAAVVFTLATTLVAAGCNGGTDTSGTDATPSSSATPSPEDSQSPSPTEAALPEPPKPPEPPKAANTTAGKKAFARYVVDTWDYALLTNDPEPLLRLSPGKKPCVGCKQLESELKKRKKQGWYVDFPGAEVKDVEIDKRAGLSLAQMSVSIPESDSYNDDGSYRSTSPAHAKGSFEVEMRFQKRSFELVSFRLS